MAGHSAIQSTVYVQCTVGSRTELTEAKIQFVTTETNYSFCIQEGNDYTLYDRNIFDKNIFLYHET